MNIEMFKKDLDISEFFSLVIDGIFGYKYNFNIEQLFSIKDSIGMLYGNIGNYTYYIYDGNILCYKYIVGDSAGMKYIDSIDLNPYIESKKNAEYEFGEVCVKIEFRKHNYSINIIHDKNDDNIISISNIYSYNKELIEIVGLSSGISSSNTYIRKILTMNSIEYGKTKLTFSRDEIVEEDRACGIKKILSMEVNE